MPYSCWMTATSLWFSNSAHAARDAAEPLTSSPTTRVLEEGGPSDTRTTLTSAPLAVNPWARAALNVAGPYGVGGYVLRMPKLGVSENLCLPGESVKHGNLNKVLKVIPTKRGHLRARRERLLGAISGIWLTQPGLPGFPTPLRIHSQGVGATREDPTNSPPRGYSRRTGPTRPRDEGPPMSDKSPRQTMSKKSGKSLKEKRADKHVKAARRAAATEAL